MQLTREQRQKYERDGFLLLPGLFSGPEIAILRAEVDRVAMLKVEEVKREADDGPPKAMFAMHQAGVATASAAMAAAVRLPRTLGLAQQVLGDEELYFHHTKVNLKSAIDGSVWPWHQDFGTWRLDGIRRPDLTTLMVTLDPSTEVNGCLYFLPGSHRDGRHDAFFDQSTAYHLWAVPHDVLAQKIRQYGPPVAITGAPGDAVIFDCNLLHASGHNLSAENRWQAYFCYNTCANRPDDVENPRPSYARGTDWTPLQLVADDAILNAGEKAA